MNDELRDMTESPAPATVSASEPSVSGIPRVYLLFGVIGILVVALAVVTTVLIMSGDQPVTQPLSEGEVPVVESSATDTISSSETHEGSSLSVASHEPEIPGFEPFDPVSIKSDSGVLGDIMANLDFLDYDPILPTEHDGSDEDGKMSKEDSIDAAKWFQQESDRLAKTEKALNDRQRELEVLDRKVSQKILRIEQAESARVTELAKLYDGMDPRSVAKLVANLDDETVVSILPRMKQKNASQVLSLMPAARAAKLSKQMITIAEN